jgi:peptidoglycan-associated lipoprotein
MIRHTLPIVCLAALALVGCANRNTVPASAGSNETVGSAGAAAGDTGAASTQGTGSGSGIGVSPLSDQEQSLIKQLVVYFDFDSSEVRPEFNDMLAAHGHYLATHPNAQLRLEGNTDERGSREYNIGLGERRAEAVRRVLLLQGASADQLSVVSYGEERPAATGHNEAAWRQNRRVDLVYRR